MSIIGDRLRELRGSSSQSEMARAVGKIKQQHWARWESGVVSPNAEMIATICRAHAVSANWLLGLPERGGVNNATATGNGAIANAGGSLTVSNAPPVCKKCPYKKLADAFKKLP